MSNSIRFIDDKQGNHTLPVTHERAVRDSSGVTLETKLGNLNSRLDQIEQNMALLPSRLLSRNARELIVSILKKAVYKDSDVGEEIDSLEQEFEGADVVSISAIFTQPQTQLTVYDSLDTFREYLVVTALFEDGITEQVTTYTLSSDTLVAGDNIITVTYGGQTDTFTVYLVRPSYVYDDRFDVVGLNYVSNAGKNYDGWQNHYVTMSSKRVSLPYFDLLVTPRIPYHYEFTFEGLGQGDTFEVGLQFFSQSMRNDALNEIAVSHGSERYDSRWLSVTISGNKATLDYTSNYDNAIGVRPCVRYMTNGTTEASNIPAQFFINSVKVTEIVQTTEETE